MDNKFEMITLKSYLNEDNTNDIEKNLESLLSEELENISLIDFLAA